ncbi:hypothetical protein FVEG_17578 [Fusarium verticillioides 7600]|uniref:Uncharacterized protein n=1 Tax=Gibberella moniliformis (strain M3125 / FGSC 7600) TaxID=334819 RepID=W7MWN1_GIBM7|nr:hypothetical protein FVEG_17578 [Fusarium verticillioides 7600]EWG55708.1 hypothetical protein FVEG_17578 [Fusarium verticillioides 7600]
MSEPRSNIGIWGWGSSDRERFKAKNKALEKKFMELGDRKWLYAHTYYTEEQFWELYVRPWYERLRKRYFATTLPAVYDKVKKSGLDADGKDSQGWEFGRLLNKWPTSGIYGMILAFHSGDINHHRRARWSAHDLRHLLLRNSDAIHKHTLINWAAKMLPDSDADMHINLLADGNVHEDDV